VSASVNLPLHHKVQKFSSGTGSPGWSRKKGHKTVVVWWWLTFLLPAYPGCPGKECLTVSQSSTCMRLPNNYTGMIITGRHPVNGLFSRTTWVSRHQKGRTNTDITATRDAGVAVTSAGPYADHLHLAADR